MEDLLNSINIHYVFVIIVYLSIVITDWNWKLIHSYVLLNPKISLLAPVSQDPVAIKVKFVDELSIAARVYLKKRCC